MKSCRAKNPEDRLADPFPTVDKASSASAATVKPISAIYRSGFASLARSISSSITCDGRGKIPSNIISSTATSATPTILTFASSAEVGRYSHDTDHLLVELRKNEIFAVP